MKHDVNVFIEFCEKIELRLLLLVIDILYIYTSTLIFYKMYNFLESDTRKNAIENHLNI